MNGEQKGAVCGSRPQGKHMGEEVTRGHCPSAHTAQVGRLKPREQERLTRVLVASSYCLPSGLLRTLSNLPNGDFTVFSDLKAASCQRRTVPALTWGCD